MITSNKYTQFKTSCSLIGLLVLLTLSNSLKAEQSGITIRGDRESPSVLYLVPWKRTPSSQGNTDFDMELDQAFIPMSRSEVIREVRYFKQVDYDKNVTVKQKKELQTSIKN